MLLCFRCVTLLSGSLLGASQVTQQLEQWPQYCMYTDANATTGTIWAVIDFCNYDQTFYFTRVLQDGSLRCIANNQCLDASDMNEGTHVACSPCKAGAPQQHWTFLPSTTPSKQLAVAESPQSGQIALSKKASANGANTVCLQAMFIEDKPDAGAKVAIMPCDASDQSQLWALRPPPPENKTTIMLEALRTVGGGCLRLEGGVYSIQVGDCEADMASMFWLIEHTSKGIRFRSALDGSLCMFIAEFPGMGVKAMNCSSAPTTGSVFAFNEDIGALQSADGFGKGCLTCPYAGIGYLMWQDCNSGWAQKFAFGSTTKQHNRTDSPSLVIYNAGQCVDEPGWFGRDGDLSCYSVAANDFNHMPGACLDDFSNSSERRGMTPLTACCFCQGPVFLGAEDDGALFITVQCTTCGRQQYPSGWTMQAGAIKFQQKCLDFADGNAQLKACDPTRNQSWSFNKSAGTISSQSVPGICLGLQEGSKQLFSVVVGSCSEGMGWQMFWDGETVANALI